MPLNFDIWLWEQLSTCVNYVKINNSMLRMRGHVSASFYLREPYSCKLNKVILLQVCKVNIFWIGSKFWLQVKASRFANYSQKFALRTCNYMTKTIVIREFLARKSRRNRDHARAAQYYLDLRNLSKQLIFVFLVKKLLITLSLLCQATYGQIRLWNVWVAKKSNSSSSCVFFLSRRLTSQGVQNCPILCSSFQFTVISQFCPILEIISPSSSWSSSCFDTTDFTFHN